MLYESLINLQQPWRQYGRETMNSRIGHLKALTAKETPDIGAYLALTKQEYENCCMEEIHRKAHFLSCFAREIPVVIDEQELIVGSMRFWKALCPGRNMGHIIVDYRMILREGIGGVQKKLAKLTTQAAGAFREAVRAFSEWIGRYARAAGELGMTAVAENCAYLTEHPPKTFHQAMQLVWFVHAFLHAEGKAAAVSFGRFDDYLYPFYKNDLETGMLTRDAAKELLQCFWLKTCEGDESQNLTVGGPVENELTYLCLEVTGELKVQQPSLSVRICDGTSKELWDRTVELVNCKLGMPAIFNDSTVIKALQNAKVAPEDAENYAIVGCYEANSDGNTFGTTANAGCIYLNRILMEFLDLEQNYQEFNQFYEDFKKFFKKKYSRDILMQFRKNWQWIREHAVSPFQSACMGDCLETGIPAEWGGCKYTMAGINILGLGTLVDSLYALQKLVFENKICTYPEFIRQVKQNFPNETLAVTCKQLKGKYGTGNPETDTLARELSVLIADLVDQGEIYPGVVPYAGLFLFLQDITSKNDPATPDGRRQGERLSYGIGASDFCQ